MDILSARKKAAERAKAKKADETPASQEPPAPGPGPDAAVQAAESVEAHEQVAPLPPASDGDTSAGPEKTEGEAAGTEAVTERQAEVLAFRLGTEEYAIPVDRVREVTKNWEITPVPNTPPHVIGVISLRGAVLPVMDLCPRLGVPAGERDEKSRIIVTAVNDEGTGVIVDRVTGVVRFLPAELRPVPDSLEHGAGAEFLRGIVRKGDRLTIVLDIDKAIET